MKPTDALLLSQSGVTYKALAAMAGVPIGTVGAWVCRARNKEGHVPRQKRMSDQHRGEILERAKRGDSLKEISYALEVPLGTVATVMRRFRQLGLLEYRRAPNDA